MAKMTAKKHVKNGLKNDQKIAQKNVKFLRLKFVSVEKHER